MKKIAFLVLASIVLCLLVFTLFVSVVYAESIVGVKEGDWVEYDVIVTGTGSLPPNHEVQGMRMAVLSVDDAAFFMNVTVRYANGTVSSAIWTFNFTAGNTEGWIVIPANLSPGDTFFDYSKPGDVPIQSEEQKVVLGATRTVTCGSDAIRHIKEWDKTTGFFVNSVEIIQNRTIDGWYIDNLTLNVRATGTNLWRGQIFGLEPSVFALLISGLAFMVILSVSALLIWQRKKLTNLSLSFPLMAKQVVLVAIIIGVVVFVYTVIPSIWLNMGLNYTEVNMIMQSVWLGLILSSLWFRKTGNNFIHGFLMTAVIIATLVSFASVLVMWTPLDSTNTVAIYFSSLYKIAEFVVHGVFSILAMIFGVWFITLWRPNSATFPDRSRHIVKLLVIMWGLSYLTGTLGYYIMDYTLPLSIY